ncbi:hypothetical protein SVAN01_11364 [Stagonosporopsis vannaccii]|nr:hypothetical protein SVAN01_11364 [Stagonosporopsis vannaccii]
MTKAIDELLALSHLPESPLTYDGPANSSGASVLKVALSRQDPNKVQIPGQHMVGTTVMGTDDGTKNGSNVVDSTCKVYGTATEHAAHKIIALDGVTNGAAIRPVL